MGIQIRRTRRQLRGFDRAALHSLDKLGREQRFTAEFLETLEGVGIESVKLPPRAPNLNAQAERFVRTSKESCLERLIWFGEGAWRRAIHQFVIHYHRERNPPGLKHQLLVKDEFSAARRGAIQRRERLGGMLNYYDRPAA